MTQEEMFLAIEKLVNLQNTSFYYEAKDLAYKLLEHTILHEDTKSLAKVYNILGLVYRNLSNYPKALMYYEKALQIFEEIGNKDGTAANLGNIGTIYTNLFDHIKALEYYQKALNINKEIGKKNGIASNYGNIGIVYKDLHEYKNALKYLEGALEIFEEINDKSGIARNLVNIGQVYQFLLDYTKALGYYEKSLTIFEEIGNKNGIAVGLGNIGIVYGTKESPFYDHLKAEVYLKKTLQLAEEIGAKDIIQKMFEQLYILRLNERLFEEALDYKLKSITLEKEIQSIEAKKQAERFDIERKNAEKEKQLAVERAEAAGIKRILHNILPINIADRILKQEPFIADHFQSVSVLFMDLVGFTTLASIAPPRQLVFLLDTIFQKADEVVELYGLEKIKTIGDGYLAVANVTTPLVEHQKATALASLQLLETMKDFIVNIPTDLGDTDWLQDMNDIEIRIGIHTGEVVAGIIGKNKYTYDLWGDAVNVASRMESNSEPGRIHISEKFAKSIEQHPEFSLIPRGTISIKGKGTMNTFWLESGKQ